MKKPRRPAAPDAALRAFDLDEYLPYLINRTGTVVAGAFSEELAQAKLTLPQWRVLAALFHQGEQRQIDLAKFTSIDQSSLSRLVSALHRRDLVSRRRSATSNREVSVTLTAKGTVLTRRYIPVALAYETIGTEGLSRADLATLRRCLKHIFANLDAWVAARDRVVGQKPNFRK
jgi:DNA-binding MarR family transcriptional regulator